jgi:hypothetical protein
MATTDGYRLRLPESVNREVQAYQQQHPNFTTTAEALRSLVVLGLRASGAFRPRNPLADPPEPERRGT